MPPVSFTKRRLSRFAYVYFRSMDTLRSEETTFAIEEVSEIIKDVVEELIGGHVYELEKVNRWAADIVDQVLTVLTNQGKPFKYIVQAVSSPRRLMKALTFVLQVIMQKNGAGLHAASSCFWDNTNDASCFVR